MMVTEDNRPVISTTRKRKGSIKNVDGSLTWSKKKRLDDRGMGERDMAFGLGGIHPEVDRQSLVRIRS